MEQTMEYEALADKKRRALRENGPNKKLRVIDEDAAMICNYSKMRRRRRKGKKKCREKKDSEVLGKALRCLLDCSVKDDEAISDLTEAVRLAPTPEVYQILGIIHDGKDDETKSFISYSLAARLSPKNHSLSLWKCLIDRCIEQNEDTADCLRKAISAHPSHRPFRLSYADRLLQLGDFCKAAEAYIQASKIPPVNIDALREGARWYLRCGEVERSIRALEDYFSEHRSDSDVGMVDFLLSICMKHKKHDKALQHIEDARRTFPEKKYLVAWVVKEGICHLHLGNMEKAKMLFNGLGKHGLSRHADLIIEVGDAYMSLEHYETALKYFLTLVDTAGDHSAKGLLFLKIARCYDFLQDKSRAITFFYKALNEFHDNIEVRLALASLLVDESRVDEAISMLSPPKENEYEADINSVTENKANSSWWLDGKIKLKLSCIYRDRGMRDQFIDIIFPLVRESLIIESENMKRKVKKKKQLPLSTLRDRAKVLDEGQTGYVFRGVKPMASRSNLLKAARAKRLLPKREMQLKEAKEKALAAGIDWRSDESEDDDSKEDIKVTPLPKLLQDEEHHLLIVDLCEALISAKRFGKAIETISLTLKLANNRLSNQKKEKLRTLAAQTADNINDPICGFNCVKYIVEQHPRSKSAWNFYFKVMMKWVLRYNEMRICSMMSKNCVRDSFGDHRLRIAYLRHSKLLRRKLTKLKDCVAPKLITGHQFTMLNKYQAAAEEYLDAYKLMPDNPLINLCVGSALINLTLGFRLQNKHQCVAQGLAFLYQNLLLSENSQEALYNLARACHHVGLVSIAASYYEKVLATQENDFPDNCAESNKQPGYCDLRREAAHNLHLIYKKSGAFDLARQVLKDHCSSI